MRTLAVAFLFAALLLGACGESKSSVAGKYMREDARDRYLEFKSDGTAYIKDGKELMHGTFEVEGRTITVKLAMGMAMRLTIDGDALAQEGKTRRWKKE